LDSDTFWLAMALVPGDRGPFAIPVTFSWRRMFVQQIATATMAKFAFLAFAALLASDALCHLVADLKPASWVRTGFLAR
jgi:hypothetical protein